VPTMQAIWDKLWNCMGSGLLDTEAWYISDFVTSISIRFGSHEIVIKIELDHYAVYVNGGSEWDYGSQDLDETVRWILVYWARHVDLP
jgi:hypothetical protein